MGQQQGVEGTLSQASLAHQLSPQARSHGDGPRAKASGKLDNCELSGKIRDLVAYVRQRGGEEGVDVVSRLARVVVMVI